MPTAPSATGEARYLIHDAVSGRFHRIGHHANAVLTRWRAVPVSEFADSLIRDGVYRNRETALEALKTLMGFLDRNRLLETGSSDRADQFAEQEARQRRPWHEIILHKYLFIRMPLFKPQAMLDRLIPWLEPWIRPATGYAIAALGIVGLFLAVRQWSDFTSTFLYFFTPTGMVFYALSLIVIKSLHEFGHAVIARRFGAAVPVIGVAFIVMFPILYTDTTDAWRLRDRRQRVLIDAGGIIVELMIACLALFAWSLLPEGPMRSIAFFAATTSWTMSLLVNLNPCMRFDGYYLLSDALGLENLQARSFALGRWQMRKTLLGIKAPKPAEDRPRLLCAYAYATWIYRVFLFIGIALLIHHLFPKAIGIVLFCVEIGVFVARPILRELSHWWGERQTIMTNKRGLITGLAMLAIISSLFIPWQRRIIVPAVIEPGEYAHIYAQADSQVERVAVRHGQSVTRGQTVLTLRSQTLRHELELAELSLTLAERQLARHAADATERMETQLRMDELIEARARVEALRERISELTIKAPIGGTIGSVHPGLEPGLQTSGDTVLFSIRGGGTRLVALAKEADQPRLRSGQPITFISDTVDQPKRRFQVGTLMPTAESRIETALLTSQQGGPIAVTQDETGALIPDQPVFAVKAFADSPATRTQRGVAVIHVEPQAPITPVRRKFVGIVLRETDF